MSLINIFHLLKYTISRDETQVNPTSIVFCHNRIDDDDDVVDLYILKQMYNEMFPVVHIL